MSEPLGQRLFRLRMARGIPVRELARRVSLVRDLHADLTEPELHRIESGVAEISFEIGLGLASVLNVRLRYLAEGTGDEGSFDGYQVASEVISQRPPVDAW